MKVLKFMKWTMLLVLGVFLMTSCSDDDDYEAPDVVKTAFAQKYGNASNVSWKQNSKGKHVASFMASGKKSDAWFEADGSWIMTKIELGESLAAVPQIVADAYNMTRFAAEGWTIDEVEEIQRAGEEGSIFKIEVEKDGEPDYDLYFTETGILIDEVMDTDDGDEDEEDFDDDDDDVIGNIPSQIIDYINDNMPGVEISVCEFEDGIYEVLVIKGQERIILHFGRDYSYIRTIYDYMDRMPDFVKEILENNYKGKIVESCIYVEEKGMDAYFLIDFEHFDIEIKITLDGKFFEIFD